MSEIAVKQNELKDGMITSRDVVSGGGLMLMPKGTVIGPRHLRMLRTWGIDVLFVNGGAGPENKREDWSLETHSEFEELAKQKVVFKFATISTQNAWIYAVEKIAIEYVALRLKNAIRNLSKPASKPGSVEEIAPTGITTAKQFLERVKSGRLPSLPPIYRRLSAAINHPETTTEMIGNIIKQDVSLAARLLRLANSAYYGHASKVESVEEAVRIIGFCGVRDLALATYVMGAFKNLPATLVDMTDFWRHCIGVGVMSSVIARERRAPERDSYFTAGLLHDLGRLALYEFAPKESERALKLSAEKAIAPCDAEKAVLGFDHSELGAELLAAWQLPPKLVAIIGGHHEPHGTNGASGDLTVHIADFLMTAVEYGSSGEGRMTPLASEAEAALNPEDLRGLVKEALQHCDELCSILSD